MPSYFASGLAEGISPFATELFKSKLQEGREQRKPSAQLQMGLLDAIRSMAQAPTMADLQSQSDAVEANAAPGSRLDMNSLVQTLAKGASPEMVQTPQPQRIMQAIKEMGISGLSGDGMTLKQPLDLESLLMAGGMGSFIPERVNKGGVTFYNPEASKERAAATVEGRGPTTAENTQIETMGSSLRSIDEIEKLLSGSQGKIPNIFQASIPGVPGQTGLAFHIKNVSDNLLRLKSGAQINEQEYRRLRSLLPEIWDGQGVAQAKLNEFKTVFQSVLQRQKGRFGMNGQVPSGQPEIDPFRQQLEAQGLIIEEELPD